ncbi:MAG: trypsin-like peptidase domain-containing protein [Armatimonadetes bacterium]|nr:trypsin-like peptidase domain-containing protein [Armatimonadota bacterium]
MARLLQTVCLLLVLVSLPLLAEEDPLPNQRFAQLAEELSPTVVNITVLKRLSLEELEAVPGHERLELEPILSSEGSGVIVDPEGLIVTNEHVVAGAEELRVTTHDGRELEVKVVGTDPGTDLALLRVEGQGQFPFAPLGDSSSARPGHWVMAIGNSFGLNKTVTVGVISGTGRVIGAGPYDEFLQTDASMNPGSSGGPLFNLQGEVIGICTAVLFEGQGIGFAIPSNLVKSVADELRRRGHVVRGFMGVGLQELTGDLRAALEVPDGVGGALVSDLLRGGPAETAGIRTGDVLIRVGDNNIEHSRDAVRRIAGSPIGSMIPVVVYRDGRRESLRVQVAPLEKQETSAPASGPSGQKPLGLSVTELQPGAAAKLGLTDLSGVIVTAVDPRGAAIKAGLQPGDIVRKVGRWRVINGPEFAEALKCCTGTHVALLIERDGEKRYVAIDRD